MNFPIGGNFNSRINLNLREDKPGPMEQGRVSGFSIPRAICIGGGFKEATDSAIGDHDGADELQREWSY